MSHKVAVLAANAEFYRALGDGDLTAMSRLWSRRRPVSCTHPSGPALLGRAAVMHSFAAIFGAGGAPRGIQARDPAVVVTGATALVICIERIGDTALMAANAFHCEDGAVWRMVNHQSARIGAESRA